LRGRTGPRSATVWDGRSRRPEIGVPFHWRVGEERSDKLVRHVAPEFGLDGVAEHPDAFAIAFAAERHGDDGAAHRLAPLAQGEVGGAQPKALPQDRFKLGLRQRSHQLARRCYLAAREAVLPLRFDVEARFAVERPVAPDAPTRRTERCPPLADRIAHAVPFDFFAPFSADPAAELLRRSVLLPRSLSIST
jgi:hypothetical protein